MILYPAIDLLGGKVVRLKRGNYNEAVVYSDHPEEIACHWQSQGAAWIHVVDLDGAKSGHPGNLPALKKIRNSIKCKIQFGGGVRSLAQINQLLAEGVDRVVIGTKALEPSFLKSASQQYGKNLAVGLDIRGGRVQVQGWLKESRVKLEQALEMLNATRVEMLIYTDIQRDGMLTGPNVEGLKNVLKLSSCKVILSGGTSELKDLEALKIIQNKKLEGVIIGKALYENKFELGEALKIFQTP